MHKSIPVVMTALGIATPALAVPAEALAATSYKGTTSNFRYGTLQVTITASGKKIKSITAKVNPTDPRSSQLDTLALPLLKKEALKANSYKIHVVSGATYTSEAFDASLYSALLKAKI